MASSPLFFLAKIFWLRPPLPPALISINFEKVELCTGQIQGASRESLNNEFGLVSINTKDAGLENLFSLTRQ